MQPHPGGETMDVYAHPHAVQNKSEDIFWKCRTAYPRCEMQGEVEIVCYLQNDEGQCDVQRTYRRFVEGCTDIPICLFFQNAQWSIGCSSAEAEPCILLCDVSALQRYLLSECQNYHQSPDGFLHCNCRTVITLRTKVPQ